MACILVRRRTRGYALTTIGAMPALGFGRMYHVRFVWPVLFGLTALAITHRITRFGAKTAVVGFVLLTVLISYPVLKRPGAPYGTMTDELRHAYQWLNQHAGKRESVLVLNPFSGNQTTTVLGLERPARAPDINALMQASSLQELEVHAMCGAKLRRRDNGALETLPHCQARRLSLCDYSYVADQLDNDTEYMQMLNRDLTKKFEVAWREGNAVVFAKRDNACDTL